MNELWEHLQEMDKLRVELDMYQRMDIEAVEWAVRYITEQVDPNKLLCRELDESQRVVEARDERIDELELREEAMRWVIWQECELAESKIARGCRWFDIEYIKHGFPKLMPEEQDNAK